VLTEDVLDRLEALGIDPCGELGEYHSVVTNCPRFSSRIDLKPGERVLRGGCWAVDLTLG
jgi:diphthamide synthase (EF-2-diphthine--ammonia ligase)